MSVEATEPPRATVIKWLRINLGVTMAILSGASAGVGFVISGTMRVAEYDYRLERMEAGIKSNVERVDSLEADRHERDERRLKLANDMGVVNQRLGVLETQSVFVGQFLHDNLGLQVRGGGRR